MVNRREVLLHGAIGTAIIAGAAKGVDALPIGTVPLRRSLINMAWNDPDLAAYRDAVGIMKNLGPAEKFNWVKLSQIHGTDPDTFHFCPHGDWYFLPWHRAYTAMYERLVRSLTNTPGFAMPYWDWTASPKMPWQFLTATTPGGKTNWLNVTDSGFLRTWPPSQPMPPEIVGPAVLTKILTTAGYENFGTSRNPAQNNVNPSWVPAGGGSQGTLEATPHNNVHNNIGGWMPTASSPRDPLFFMHHSNIDRIWALWNTKFANSTDPLWTGMTFTNNFINTNGTSWSPKVSSLFVPEALGYRYQFRLSHVIQSPRLTALSGKLTTLFSAPTRPANTAAIATFAAANDGTARAGRPLKLSVAVPSSTLDAVRKRAATPSGTELFSIGDAIEANATGTRALAFLRDVDIMNPVGTMFRIFLDGPDVTENTPISDPHYVGTFGVLRHVHHEGHSAPSFVLDLTDALQRVATGGEQQVGLVIVAVPGDGTGKSEGTARPERVEISFIAN